MKIYNTLTRKKENFEPLREKKVSFYHCGPTVYWTQHIGNMRAVVIADLVNRSLAYLGNEVSLVRNYTDVGHLTGDNIGDADSGIDRMEKAAKREQSTPEQIAQRYTEIYEKDRASLNTLAPSHCPAATAHIPEMIEMVKTLLEKGFAYTTDLAIYFDVSKKADYTKLSGQDLNEQISNAGSGDISDTAKKNPADFALWFFKAGAHEKALQTWESPFYSSLVKNGEGFPGWHIECSAMAQKYLGDTLDIHMGGVEHISIHHTNEIAQSESATGKEFARFWLHNEHLLVDGGKMSKSEGTSFTISDLVKKGFSALDLRYFFLQAHYRSKQNFTWEGLRASQKTLKKIKKQLSQIESNSGKVDVYFKNNFLTYIEDDFNIPAALGVFHTMMKSDISNIDKKATALDFDMVLGLNLEKTEQNTLEIEIPEKVQQLLEQRKQARLDKNWGLSDELRDEIEKYGYHLSDEPEGQKIKKIKNTS